MSPEHRKFARISTGTQIKVQQIALSPANYYPLNNVSFGGLAFKSDNCLEKGTIVGIQVLIELPVDLIGEVAWCRKHNKHFDVGVRFMGKSDLSRKHMIQEIERLEEIVSVDKEIK